MTSWVFDQSSKLYTLTIATFGIRVAGRLSTSLNIHSDYLQKILATTTILNTLSSLSIFCRFCQLAEGRVVPRCPIQSPLPCVLSVPSFFLIPLPQPSSVQTHHLFRIPGVSLPLAGEDTTISLSRRSSTKSVQGPHETRDLGLSRGLNWRIRISHSCHFSWSKCMSVSY